MVTTLATQPVCNAARAEMARTLIKKFNFIAPYDDIDFDVDDDDVDDDDDGS